MVIKVELYYELTKKGETKFPEHSKAILQKKVEEEIPKLITIESNWWNGTEVTAKKLTIEELHEKIRTAK